MVYSETFWHGVAEACLVSEPIVKVLRLVNGENHAMAYLYEAMDRAKEAIRSYYADKGSAGLDRHMMLWDVIDSRWTGMLHRPNHAATLFLNPAFSYKCGFDFDGEVMEGLHSCIHRMVPDLELHSKINCEIHFYRDCVGLFGFDDAIRERTLFMPHIWWRSYGARAPNLQKLAIRILSQTCSSSGCEHNWSVFEKIHAKKRNKYNFELQPSVEQLHLLYIDSSGVSGEIPSTLGMLRNLQKLWASDNQLTGRIPDFIGSWNNLIDLRLQGNALKGPIPSSFSNLTSLTQLRLSDITSGVSSLSFLKNLKNLTQLVLRNNMISGEMPSFIGEISGLQYLDLSFNKFTGGIPNSFQNMSSLLFLFLGDNNLSGKLPSQRSASLAYIDLSYNHFSGALPTWIGDKNLKVNLVGNYFTTNETDNSPSTRGLSCLQRTFPCNRGAPRYSDFAINCGGQQITSAIGVVYEKENETLNAASFYVSNTQNWGVSDTGYFLDSNNPTYIATSQSQFTKTLDTELYQTARLSPSSLRYYGLGLENGPYAVNLQFAETMFVDSPSWKSVGRRIFDVYVQGQKVLTDFDIRKEAGGSNIALVRSFKTNVTENFLEIHFFWAGKGTCCIPRQGTYGPLVSAISVT